MIVSIPDLCNLSYFVARSVGVVLTNFMAPMKILKPTLTPLTIHKGKLVGEFQILDRESQIHNTEPGKTPSGMSHYCSNASFQSNGTKSRVMLIFCPISTYTQMNGLGMKKIKSHSYC